MELTDTYLFVLEELMRTQTHLKKKNNCMTRRDRYEDILINFYEFVAIALWIGEKIYVWAGEPKKKKFGKGIY